MIGARVVGKDLRLVRMNEYTSRLIILNGEEHCQLHLRVATRAAGGGWMCEEDGRRELTFGGPATMRRPPELKPLPT